MFNLVQMDLRVMTDPEFKTVGNAGTALVTFKGSVSRGYKEKDSQFDASDVFTFKAWKGWAEWISNNISKGDKLFISGAVRIETSEKDGVKRYFTEIIIDKALKLEGRKVAGEAASVAQKAAPAAKSAAKTSAPPPAETDAQLEDYDPFQDQ